MIMLHAIACSHGVEPVKNGTALTSTKATLRAQVYSATLRTSLAVLKAAAIENPRLITALTAVISAQKRNGMLIQDANGVDAPSQDTASSDYQVEKVGGYVRCWHTRKSRDVREIALETKRIAGPARGYVRLGEVCVMLSLSPPCRGQNVFRTGKREMINGSQLI